MRLDLSYSDSDNNLKYKADKVSTLGGMSTFPSEINRGIVNRAICGSGIIKNPYVGMYNDYDFIGNPKNFAKGHV